MALSKFISISVFFVLLYNQANAATTAAIDCKKIRFSDIGWTDITATTAVASIVLESIGYEAKITQLSVPVTYVSLKNRDLDVFLGNWMPSMAADIRPYHQDKSVETLGPVVKNARYTLAVPKYVSDAGVHSLADLAKNKNKFRGRIYGIEPGNDGNRLVQKMINDSTNGIKDWKLIESSEQAMLMEVSQAIKKNQWIVFLGWEPHPMNKKFQMTYLNGTDAYFGPNHGSSTVYINTRKNYANECPSVARFLRNFSLSIEMENVLMSLILDEGMEPKAAARKWIQSHPEKLNQWLEGVQTIDGRPGSKVASSTLLHQ